MIKLPTPNSQWSGSDGVTFTVKELFEKDGESWIRYVKDKDQSEYTCLTEAFLPRFREMPK